MLDNGSRDGSAEAARAHPAVDEVIAVENGAGKGLNDSELLRRARGQFALPLNEDSELLPGASSRFTRRFEAARRSLRGRRAAPALRLAAPTGARAGLGLALPHAAHRARGRALPAPPAGRAEPRDQHPRGRLVPVRGVARAHTGRRAGRLPRPAFFVYSDEVDFARRLRDAGWRSLWVPAAVAIHHEQLSTDAIPERRIVEMARNRDLYMRKHHSPAAARAVRWLTAWAYAVRALAALCCSPATRHAATGATSLRRCTPSAARGCARPPPAYNRAGGGQ